MPKDWMDLPRYSEEYINGVISFLDFAYSEGEPDGRKIQCPCKRCCNINWYRRDVVFDHLVADGFVKGYRTWVAKYDQVITAAIGTWNEARRTRSFITRRPTVSY